LLPRTIGLVKFIYKFIMVSETNRLQAESDGQKQRFSLFPPVPECRFRPRDTDFSLRRKT
jgi:hypothetical protein